jgi:16S rRNA (cytosine967-C5)-methyltransferase
MTPSARLSAATFVLDEILTGRPPEMALTAWGRASRFAGSGDRHAVRDLVFDALRCKRSYAALGGAMTGRGLILGGLRAKGADVDALFTGLGHAPAMIDVADQSRDASLFESLDCPDWLAPALQDSLGADFAATMRAMQLRAPIYLRINTLRGDIKNAYEVLLRDGIGTQLIQTAKNALQVTDGDRKIQNSTAYQSGLVELQDASSQAVIEAIDIKQNSRILDYCAGGGGKTLGMACFGPVDAYDAAPNRMRDLPERAARAGADVRIINQPTGPYDLILVDAPCSGSGSWRRDPAGKWALTAARLNDLIQIQADILDKTAEMLAPKGVLAYVTCSLLGVENEQQISGFLARHPNFHASQQHRFSPLTGGDGFFLAVLTQNDATPTII